MTARSTQYATFVIERAYDAAPARVFSAWADPAAKSQWFGAPDDAGAPQHELDFRVGGREINRGGPPGGPVYTYDSRYADIVPNERIVYTYTMDEGETRISASVATIVFEPAGAGTKLVLTEQAVFLDGRDTPKDREHGTRELLASLDEHLRSGVASTS